MEVETLPEESEIFTHIENHEIPSEIAKSETNTIKKTESTLFSWYKKYFTYIKWSVAVMLVHLCLLNPTSPLILEETEKKILNYIKTPYKSLLVDIGMLDKPKESNYWYFWNSQKNNESNEIRTLIFNENSDKTPIVIIHGLCAAAGLWAVNIDGLAESRPVYVIDLLGFGRSSRPDFPADAGEVEAQHVAAIEAWRKEMQLERFILMGHSMGGFLTMAYTLKHPERVAHLIVVDGWGFPQKPENMEEMFPASRRTFVFKLIFAIAQRVNPLGIVRALGPLGPSLIGKIRPDLVRKFEVLNQDGNANVAEYIFHSNAQRPSGEEAFRTLNDHLIFAKNPMENRIHELKSDIPLTVIYGEKSWVKQIPDETFRQLRPDGSFLDIYRIKDCGHHVYTENAPVFNQIVSNAGIHTDKLLLGKEL